MNQRRLKFSLYSFYLFYKIYKVKLEFKTPLNHKRVKVTDKELQGQLIIEGLFYLIVPSQNERTYIVVVFVFSIYFVNKSSVDCNPLLPVTRDSLPFVYSVRDVNGIK